MATKMVHVRIDEKVNQKASATLKKTGMSASNAVRIMLIRVAAEEALSYGC